MWLKHIIRICVSENQRYNALCQRISATSSCIASNVRKDDGTKEWPGRCVKVHVCVHTCGSYGLDDS